MFMTIIEDLAWRIKVKNIRGDKDAIEYAIAEIEKVCEHYRNGAFDEAARMAEDGNTVITLEGTNMQMPVGLVTAIIRTNIGKAIRAIAKG
jgi:hypothetical protein